MSEYLVIVTAAALVNGAVFTDALGLSPEEGVSGESGRALACLGGGVIAVMTAASALSNLLYSGLLLPYGLEFLGPVLYIPLIAALALGADRLLRGGKPEVCETLHSVLPWIAGNCAVLGAVLNGASLSFRESVLSAFGASVCFAVALFSLTAIRGRIVEEELPASVRGWPVLLLTGALLCMALMGLTALA